MPAAWQVTQDRRIPLSHSSKNQNQRRRTGVSAPHLLRVRHLLARFVVRAEPFRDRLQRGIELHERVLDRSVLLVTGPAGIVLGHGARALPRGTRALGVE